MMLFFPPMMYYFWACLVGQSVRHAPLYAASQRGPKRATADPASITLGQVFYDGKLVGPKSLSGEDISGFARTIYGLAREVSLDSMRLFEALPLTVSRGLTTK